MRRKISDSEFKKLAFLIEQAYIIAGKDNEFVRSCEMFLIDRRFLSKKQIDALHKVKPPRSYHDLDDGDYIMSNWINPYGDWTDD